MKEPNELKPCPCCNGNAIIIAFMANKNLYHYAKCTECSIRTGIYRDRKTVKIQWNRRANKNDEEENSCDSQESKELL